MSRYFFVLLGVLLLGMGATASGEVFSAKVIEVLDGDTVLIVHSGGLMKVRLAEIDAPEKAQAFATDSTQSLSGMVKSKQVKFASQTIDQYGRMVARLEIDGLDVNAEQIRRGMAWEYSNFHGNKMLVALQNEARQARRGLWVQVNPTPPWNWRKLHPITPRAGEAVSTSIATVQVADGNCGKKKQCPEMISCEEAKYYFNQCNIRTLDGDGDGIPCENLCLSAKKIKN